MPDRSGTLERIAEELGEALGLLAPALARERILESLARSGVRFPPALLADAGFDAARQATADAATALGPALAALAAAFEAEDPIEMARTALEVLQQARVTIASFEAFGNALAAAAAGLPDVPAAELARITTDFPRKLLDLLIVAKLDQLPAAGATLGVLGLIDRAFVLADPAVPASEDYETATLRFDRLGGLLSAPTTYFQDVYGWGSPTFDGVALLSALRDLLARLQMPVLIRPPTATSPAVLEAFAVDLTVDPTQSPPGLRVDVVMPIGGTFEETIDLPDEGWTATVTAAGRLQVGVTGQLRPPFDLSLTAPTPVASGSLGVMVRGPTEPFVVVGQAGGSRLEVSGVEATVAVDLVRDAAGPTRVVPRIEGKIDRGKLVIDGQGDGFVSALLRSAAVQADFGLAFGWSEATGVRFEGSATLEIGVPVHVQIGPVDISTVYLILSLRDGTFPLELAVDMSARLGPLTALVSRLGVEAVLSFPPGGGNVGPADLAFHFKPPLGVGLSVDAGPIRGGGFLRRDPANGDYAGAVELVFGDFLNLKAIGIINTGGSTGFSLLIIITAEFNPGFQLGFGFVLHGVGGMLGLNRGMRLDALTEGVRTGSAAGILFPRDVIENAPRIISDLGKFFPPEPGKFLVGPMAKLTWGTPTVLSLSLGIVIEIPGNIALLGVLRLTLPTEDEPLVLIQIAFLGALEFDKRRLWFFASLFESRFLFIPLEGDMGALASVGEDAALLASVGGFHPRFVPPPMPFPELRRITMNILNEEHARLRAEGYLALTANSRQFGARLDFFFGFSRFSVQGHLAFDALVQIFPLYFIVDMSGSVALRAFGVDVFTIRLQLTLEGPAPWRARGRGGISFFFFSISANFDVTWGGVVESLVPLVDVLALLAEELAKPTSWRAVLPPGIQLLVSLRAVDQTADLVLHPVGKLRVSQLAAPLTLTLDRIGAQKPRDANRFSLRALSGGLAVAGEAREPFAVAQFQEMDDASKLSRPSFEPLPAGVELAPDGADRTSSRAVRRVVRYEEHVIDTAFVRVRRFADYFGGLFAHFLDGGSVGKSPLSRKRHRQRQPFATAGDQVAVKPEMFVVAFQADNRPVTTQPAFASEAEARQHLRDEIGRDPRHAETLHVIPGYEAAA